MLLYVLSIATLFAILPAALSQSGSTNTTTAPTASNTTATATNTTTTTAASNTTTTAASNTTTTASNTTTTASTATNTTTATTSTTGSTTTTLAINISVPAVVTINGAWSPWSTSATGCINETTNDYVSCGGGAVVKTRSCTNPKPQGILPKQCPGPPKQTVPCNTDPCDIVWGNFSDCNVTCGRGRQQAITYCSSFPGGDLEPCFINFPNKSFVWVRDCNTWNMTTCPSPCDGYECQDFANCVDRSTVYDPIPTCVCQLGRWYDKKSDSCRPATTPGPTPRPVPTLPVGVKQVTTAITKSASTLLVIFVGVTLFLFASFRIYDVARVIQMNMEISLISAHIVLLYPGDPTYIEICRIQSILIHFFYTACFIFMFLESLHVYSLVAQIVPRDGLLNRTQNMMVGWGISAGILFTTIALQYDNYGATYMCWLDLQNFDLALAQLIPLVVLIILIFTMIEAAGNADYKSLKGIDPKQLLSAKIMQRSNVLIMPLVFASFMTGVLSEYEQNVALYGTFTTINGVLGGTVFFLHCSSNATVRDYINKIYRKLVK